MVTLPAMVRLSSTDAVAGVGAESVTPTVKVKLPATVGVPAIIPPLLKVKPAGSAPDKRLHV